MKTPSNCSKLLGEIASQSISWSLLTYKLHPYWLSIFSPLHELNDHELIDMMRIVPATIDGFITAKQAGLVTLERSTNASYEVMLNALIIVIVHIRHRSA